MAKKAAPTTKSDPLMELLFPGYFVAHFDSDGRGSLRIELEPDRPAVCPRCGKPCPDAPEIRRRVVRDAEFPGAPFVWLNLPVRRVECRCGSSAEEDIPWVDPHVDMTTRLVEVIARRLRLGVTAEEISRDLKLEGGPVRKLGEG